MDGKESLYRLRELLAEEDDSTFMDDKVSFDFLQEAANEFSARTSYLKTEQSITTVADQAAYTLNADFIKLYLENNQNQAFITYNDGNSNTFLYERAYSQIVLSDQSTSVSVPSHFAVKDDGTLDTQVSSTTTSDGAATAGECTLTDSTAPFTDVSPGDIAHNTTDGSSGIVLEVTSTSALQTALFNGTDDDWTSGDSYVIQPQGRFQVVLDPPPSTDGHTITIHYVKRPVPVYSDYRMFRFPPNYMTAILKYAAFLYKYRDREPDFGNAFFQHWEREIRTTNNQINKGFRRKKFQVNLKARR